MQQAAVSSPPRWLRPIYLVAGLVSLGLGVIGLFLPLIPTTGPLLLAAFFFGRSSERLHRWLTGHARFGRLISDFEEGRGLPQNTKVVAAVMMVAAFGYSIVWLLSTPLTRGIAAAIGIGAIVVVLRLPTAPR